MKNKIYNIILLILVSALLIVAIFIIAKYTNNQVKEKELNSVVEEIKMQIEEEKQTSNNNTVENKKIETKYKGYNVVGIIKIPTIKIEYPIIDKTSDETMEYSITKFWGNNVNDIGNFTMAGHHYLDGTMFGKLDKLKLGENIEMTDLTGNTIEYKIFDIYIIDPNEVEFVKSVQENTREITLITCINGRKNRLIIKARENI